jgi:hypothetical protein
MKSWNDFAENEDDARKEEKVKEESKDIERRLKRMRERDWDQ